MLANHKIVYSQTCLKLRVANLNDLEIMRNIKMELIRRRREIDAVKNVKEKDQVLRVYADLLTSLEIGTLGSPTSV